ncbi:MAG: hypothetical protein IJH43_09100 [Mogibacterium sp.]|nr:hypothetical protein [Mogibacterium sp.]
MNNTQMLKEFIGQCGIAGSEVLSNKAEAERYIEALFHLLDIMKTITPDEIKAAGYPANIESTLLMDQYLIDGTVTEEFDQLSLLSTLATYVYCNGEGRPGHSSEYMDRVTALRKVIEKVYGTEAMRFCGSDGC